MCYLCLQYRLREPGSYILRDTPEPWQLKAPGPRTKQTKKQVEETRKENGSPHVRGTNTLVRGTDLPGKANKWPS